MRHARWLDHLPAWLALVSVYASDIFSARELALMALPLLAAAAVEAFRLDLGRWRRLLEVGSLGLLLLLVLLRTSVLVTWTGILFVLCGARLALPRELAQRRQVLLQGFALFLTTCVSSTEPHFLVWSLAWAGLAALLLMVHAWDGSAKLRRGPFPGPPFRKLLPWTLVTLLLAVPFFLIMPRLTPWGRGYNFGIGGMGALRAGFSEILDLGMVGGPIGSNGEVVLRITPGGAGAGVPKGFPGDFALFRGVALENVEGMKWQANVRDLESPYLNDDRRGLGQEAELFLYPSPAKVIPVPYLPFHLEGRLPSELVTRPGGRLAWKSEVRRGVALSLRYRSEGSRGQVFPEAASRLRGVRRSALLQVEPAHEAAHRWSLRVAPGDLPAQALADTLVAAFGRFRYSLDNPSGQAPNPLEDFLGRTQAGHCEYFASALALALRSRGVPARIVNGYRLGPYNDAGGYFLVTQNEAHSWVEYWDPAIEAWRVADPTPPAPASPYAGEDALARFRKWADALQYHWDRHVVRFSDEDQMAGAAWLAERADRARSGLAHSTGWRLGIYAAAGALALLLGWRTWRWLPGRASREKRPDFSLKPLQPLLKRTRDLAPPIEGETLRAWFGRLAILRPDRAEALAILRDLIEGEAYGNERSPDLKGLVREESRHWA